jgi:hypothetical protein
MNQPRDYADSEVKGLDRYFPTLLSRALLVAFLTAPVGAFWVLVQNSDQLMPGYDGLVQNLVAGLVALALALAIVVTIVFDLIVVANQSKHRRIRHFSNQHPQMSFGWLWQNAQAKHYIFLVAIFILGVVCGKCL